MAPMPWTKTPSSDETKMAVLPDAIYNVHRFSTKAIESTTKIPVSNRMYLKRFALEVQNERRKTHINKV